MSHFILESALLSIINKMLVFTFSERNALFYISIIALIFSIALFIYFGVASTTLTTLEQKSLVIVPLAIYILLLWFDNYQYLQAHLNKDNIKDVEYDFNEERNSNDSSKSNLNEEEYDAKIGDPSNVFTDRMSDLYLKSKKTALKNESI